MPISYRGEPSAHPALVDVRGPVNSLKNLVPADINTGSWWGDKFIWESKAIKNEKDRQGIRT